MGSVNLFQTGKSGLFASRSALSTTGHNIANVNTEGYSRQRVEQTAMPPSQIGNLVYGTGTKVKQIHRINDEYLTKQISNESKLLGQYEEKDLALSQAEEIFNEINNAGMNRLLAKFFNEFRKLGNEPESESLRATVKESADQLTSDFKRISRSIRDIQKNLDIRIESNVRETNDLVEKIAHLNGQIKDYEVRGGEAADLRDSRDRAIKALSTIADVSVATNEKGELTIGLAGVGPLVSGQLFNKMTIKSEKADINSGRPEGSFKVVVENFAAPDVTEKLKNGRLGGLLEARDAYLGKSMSRIDELAYTLGTKINEIHKLGYSINGTTGLDFFKNLNQVHGSAENLVLNEQIQKDANNIATAIAAESPGDNRLVQFISRLQHARIMSNGKSTFDDHYNATVSDLATVSGKNKSMLEHQGHVLTHLNKVRDSISGVSLDEETTNLVQFQHAFDASAKVVKVADEMLETILNIRR